MKINKKIIIVLGCIVILANIFPITDILARFVDQRHYRYSNADGSMTFTEFMSRDFGMMKRRHNICLLARPDLTDKKIYRLFTKNPLAFWRWRLYFSDERYKLPYRDWDEIKKVRQKENIKEIQGCIREF